MLAGLAVVACGGVGGVVGWCVGLLTRGMGGAWVGAAIGVFIGVEVIA